MNDKPQSPSRSAPTSTPTPTSTPAPAPTTAPNPRRRRADFSPAQKSIDLSGWRAPTAYERVRDAGIFFGIGTLFLLTIAIFLYATPMLVLAFASILLAIMLSSASVWLCAQIPIPYQAGVLLITVGALLLLSIAGWLLAPQIVQQGQQIAQELPQSINRLRAWLESFPLLRDFIRFMPGTEQLMSDTAAVLTGAHSFFSGLLGVFGNTLIVLFVGIYLALQPEVYIAGVLKLLPRRRRLAGRKVLEEMGQTLRLWLRGKLLSMLVVGAATAVALSLLDVPLALTLGVIAGILDFIPYLGPILAALPAVLIAFLRDPLLAIYVALAFTVLQLLEGYLLLPLVERKTVSLPPGLTIMMQVLLAIPLGLVGIALATPLAAVMMVLVGLLYVEEVLDDAVTLPGDVPGERPPLP